MKKIQVCHVVSGLISGGVETMIYNYCSKMNSEEFEFHILYQHEASSKNYNDFSSLNFNLFQLPEKRKYPIKNFLKTYKYIKEKNIDVIHCHMNFMNCIPLLAAKLAGVKVRICHSHTNNVTKKNFFKRAFESFCKYLSVKFATDYLACGTDAGKYMYKDKISYQVITNALDLSKYEYSQNERQKIRKKYRIKDNEILIGHVGRFVDVKNHIFIINIFEKIVSINSKYKLMLIGDGELIDDIKKMVLEKKLNNNIIFTGIIQNTYDYYNAMDLFILPSKFEGMPMAALEAQANGLICFFSNTIDKNTIVDKEKSEFLELKEKKWIDKIINIKKYKRIIKKELFIEKKLEINSAIDNLKMIYKK